MASEQTGDVAGPERAAAEDPDGWAARVAKLTQGLSVFTVSVLVQVCSA